MRQFCFGTGICAAAALIAAGLAGCPELSRNVRRTVDLVYGQGYVRQGDAHALRPLRFDLIEPKDNPGPGRRAVVMVHGGGFDGGSKDDDELVALADRLAQAGFACFLIDYRLTLDDPPAPPPFDQIDLERAAHAATVDTKAALRHVRAHAEQYGIDPDRIALFGESAGAIAAFGAGITGPAGYASDGEAFPIPESNSPGVDSTPAVIIDFWGSADRILEEFDAIDPPILVVHGTNDFQLGTFYSAALNIVAACQEHGIPYRIHTLLGEGHGAWDAEWDGKDLATLVLEFLDDFMP